MLYYILRSWVRWYASLFYSKTYFTGLDKLPRKGPIIIAINHPTAFTEFAYLGGATLRGRNFMLRGDLFLKNKIVAAMLRSLKCIPIYRAQDGIANLKKNEATLQYCYKLLGKGSSILIAAEGSSALEKHLRTIQKGTARMVFGTYEKYKRADILVIPTGINYAAANELGSKLYVNLGRPIPLSDYLADYEKNPRRAVKLMTDRLGKELRERVVHIEDKTDYALADKILQVAENNYWQPALPKVTTKPSPLFSFIEITERFNELNEQHKQQLKLDVAEYFEQLQLHNLKDIGVAQPGYYNWKISLALLIGFIPFVIGWLGICPSYYFARNFVDKNIKQAKFYASTLIALGAMSFLFYFIALLIISLLIGNIQLISLAILLPIFCYFATVWRDFAIKWKEARKFKRLEKSDIANLKNLRAKVHL